MYILHQNINGDGIMKPQAAFDFQEQHLQRVVAKVASHKVSTVLLTVAVAFCFMIIHQSHDSHYQHAKKFVSTIKEKIHNID